MRATVMTHPWGYMRSHWAALVIGVVCVAIAGCLSNATEELDHEVRREVRTHQRLPLSDTGQTLAVAKVEAGRMIQKKLDDPTASGGVFVVVTLKARTPGERALEGLVCTLDQGGAETRPVSGTMFALPEPGLQSIFSLVFESDPDRLAGATLLCRPVESIVAYRPVYAFDLGLTQQSSEEARARTQPVEYINAPETSVME